MMHNQQTADRRDVVPYRRLILTAGLLMLFLPLIPVAEMRGLIPLLLEFPLRTHRIEPPPFSIAVFSVFTLMALLLVVILLFPSRFGIKPAQQYSSSNCSAAFPVWGWIGVVVCVAAWVCAWGRFEILEVINDYMFFPLWLGYILTVDALVYRRSGSSMISKSPQQFFPLFPASALAWWYFEYINRFVQNWWYVGVEDYSAMHYAVLATVSFATVFPAVFETRDLLGTFSWFRNAYANGPTWREPSRGELFAWLLVGIIALFATGWNPVAFFYLAWLAPLIILGSMMALAGIETPLTEMRRGNYGPLFTLAVAALICGWFWEMWNYYSMPKWHYSVPFVMKYRIFEMPIPGYAGYLPFGPICWLMWASMRGVVKR
jgi:hypothetical protein